MEDTANCEAGAVGGADRRLYLCVIPTKEMLPAGSGHTRSFWRTWEMGILGLVQHCAVTGSSRRWDGMGSAGGRHRGTRRLLKGCYLLLIIFQES